MSAVLVDSNIFLDVMTEDASWLSWSVSAIERAADTSRLVTNPVIYAEASVRFTRIEELDAALPSDLFEREPIPYEAAFLAGKASPTAGVAEPAARRFRTFLSGPMQRFPATACSRASARYRAYFLKLSLIAPD
jgi:hypothetical protein